MHDTTAPEDHMGVPAGDGYQDRFIAFVDILGFRDLLTDMDRSPEIFGTVRRSLYSVAGEELRVRWGDEENDEFKLTYEMLDSEHEASPSEKTGTQMTAFSDCYLISELPARLPYLIARVHRLAFQFLLNGIVTRGGIVQGPIHHRLRVAFGPGMVAAYELEQRVAMYPRIVVDPAVASQYLPWEEAFRRNFSSRFADRPVESLLTRDVDGSWFLNPFVIVPERSTIGYGMLTFRWERAFQHIRDQLVNRLRFEIDRGVAAHVAKIRWLIFHFNRSMEGFPGRVPPIDVDAPG